MSRQAEQEHAEFAGWMEAQGYPSPEDRYDGSEMAEAFAAGMQAQRDLAAVQPAPEDAEVAYERWIEHRDPASVGSRAGFTAGWQAAVDAALWPLCPNGCGCRLGTQDADQKDCACDGLCCYCVVEVSEVFAERDRLRSGIESAIEAAGRLRALLEAP